MKRHVLTMRLPFYPYIFTPLVMLFSSASTFSLAPLKGFDQHGWSFASLKSHLSKSKVLIVLILRFILLIRIHQPHDIFNDISDPSRLQLTTEITMVPRFVIVKNREEKPVSKSTGPHRVDVGLKG